MLQRLLVQSDRTRHIPLRLCALSAEAERRIERVEVAAPARLRQTLVKEVIRPRDIAAALGNLPKYHERIAHIFGIVRLARCPQ